MSSNWLYIDGEMLSEGQDPKTVDRVDSTDIKTGVLIKKNVQLFWYQHANNYQLWGETK